MKNLDKIFLIFVLSTFQIIGVFFLTIMHLLWDTDTSLVKCAYFVLPVLIGAAVITVYFLARKKKGMNDYTTDDISEILDELRVEKIGSYQARQDGCVFRPFVGKCSQFDILKYFFQKGREYEKNNPEK